MREVEVSRLTDVIEKLCIEANEHLPEDVKCAIKTCRACEDGEIAKGVLDNIIENFDIHFILSLLACYIYFQKQITYLYEGVKCACLFVFCVRFLIYSFR